MSNYNIGKITGRASIRKWSFSAIIFLIVIAAVSLRLYSIEDAPPGLNQDSASNAWNAYCMLKTGGDQDGAKWPIFTAYGLGGHRSTLFMYLLLPFQLLGGLNVITTRLPAAFFGVFSVIAVYYVARKLFDKPTALIAATLLAFNPWSIQQSRWGHEASVCALFGILPLALMLWASLPVIKFETGKPRPFRAIIAGLITGISCYGYQALRIFIPVMLFVLMLVSLPCLLEAIGKDKRILISVLLFLLAFSLIFAPLAAKHITEPEIIAKRLQSVPLFAPSATMLQKASHVLSRYAMHFDPRFLFFSGDVSQIQSPPGIGQFHYYMIPLMLIGLGVMFKNIRKSIAARIVIALVLVYPAGDCLAGHTGAHALRSYPGICGLILVAAFGAYKTFEFLKRFDQRVVITVVYAFVLIAGYLNVTYLYRYFGSHNRQPFMYHAFHSDLVEACKWLKPDLHKYDAVFVTEIQVYQPYVITLLSLDYEPDKWFNDKRNHMTTADFDVFYSYGKMNFMHGDVYQKTIRQLKGNGTEDNVLFIIRPGELPMTNPVHQIKRPDGLTTLDIYNVKL